MRKVLAVISPLIFVLFTACGGGGSDSPPPPATSPAGNLTLGDMRNQIARAKKSCSDSLTPVIISALSAKQQGATNPALLALLSQGSQGGQGGGCSNLLMNILMQAKTVDNGSWINKPQSKIWLALQVAALMNKVGQGVQAAGYNPQQALNQLPINQYVNQSLLPSMTGGLGGNTGNQLRTAVNQYTGNLSQGDPPVSTGPRPPMTGGMPTLNSGGSLSSSTAGGSNSGPGSGTNLNRPGVTLGQGGGLGGPGGLGSTMSGNGAAPSGSSATGYGGALLSIPLSGSNGIISDTLAGTADPASEPAPRVNTRALLPTKMQSEVVDLEDFPYETLQRSGLPRVAH